MTETKQFVEDMVKGGGMLFDITDKSFTIKVTELEAIIKLDQGTTITWNLGELLIRPSTWQAVGEVRGWDEGKDMSKFSFQKGITYWMVKAHRFLDHRLSGKTIEESLKAIR